MSTNKAITPRCIMNTPSWFPREYCRGPQGMMSAWVRITPDIAKQILSKNINRKERANRIRLYAMQLRRKHWAEHHQGIAIDPDGYLRDGQHRLYAIIESDASVWMLVTLNVDPHNLLVCDIHGTRNDADAITLDGFEADSREVAIAKRMYLGMSCGNVGTKLDDRTELREFMEKHCEAIRFASLIVRRKRIGNAGVTAVIARAWYTAPREKLSRFMEILISGEMQRVEEKSAVRLRDFLLTAIIPNGDAGRASLYRKVQSALVAFLQDRPLDKLYEASAENFPLPEEGD